jgi:hypothetical protein
VVIVLEVYLAQENEQYKIIKKTKKGRVTPAFFCGGGFMTKLP